MPRIGLKVECQLENLATFECPGDDFRWFLKVCCGNCGEITDWVYATSEEQIPVKGLFFLKKIPLFSTKRWSRLCTFGAEL